MSSIEFEWTELETVRYTNRITVDRAELEAWIAGKTHADLTIDTMTADDFGWFLSDVGGEPERSNREVDPSTEYVDLEIKGES